MICVKCDCVIMSRENEVDKICEDCVGEVQKTQEWNSISKTKKAKITHYWLGLLSNDKSDKWVEKTIEDQKTCDFSDMPMSLILKYKNNIDQIKLR